MGVLSTGHGAELMTKPHTVGKSDPPKQGDWDPEAPRKEAPGQRPTAPMGRRGGGRVCGGDIGSELSGVTGQEKVQHGAEAAAWPARGADTDRTPQLSHVSTASSWLLGGRSFRPQRREGRKEEDRGPHGGGALFSVLTHRRWFSPRPTGAPSPHGDSWPGLSLRARGGHLLVTRPGWQEGLRLGYRCQQIPPQVCSRSDQ